MDVLKKYWWVAGLLLALTLLWEGALPPIYDYDLLLFATE